MNEEKFHELSRLVSERADDVRQEFLENWERDFESVKRVCESPIEILLSGHLLLITDGYERVRWLAPSVWGQANPIFKTMFSAQVRAGEYRADFMFRCNGLDGEFRLLAVECDGHEFHERTKAQARRDKQRDRWMAANGIAIMRFTGSEIFRDPAACAEEVETRLSQLMDDAIGLSGKRRDPTA